MYCEKCGTKNELDAKFCEKCGNKLNENNDSNNDLKSITKKIKNLPKKNKIVMSAVIGILIIAVITIGILLNNPVKKVEDSLNNYYKYYNKNSNRELKEIGKILISNKNDEKVLKRIKETTHNIMESWVKNFNTEYKNAEALSKSYNKVNSALNDIYDYYNGLEYMLDRELYNKYYEELSNLNKSKSAYLKGQEYEDKQDEYNAYYNYGKVIEEDSYYRNATNYINNYVKEEINDLKTKAEELVKINEASTDTEIYDYYIAELKYLNENKIRNNIDLSSTADYQELYNNVGSKIIEYLKKVIEEYNEDDLDKAIAKIEDTKKLFDSENTKYQELEDLKKTYEDKLPVSLIDTHRISKSLGANSSLWGKTINGEEYDFYLSFALNKENSNITYRLNKEYKRLKTKIVKDEDWNNDIKGYFVITGDDKEIYKSNVITKDSELIDIDIDVTDIDNLKIEFIIEGNNNIFNLSNIYLVEPYLYK